jgi:hypothetical protein
VGIASRESRRFFGIWVLVAGLVRSDSKVWNHPWFVPQFGIAVLLKLEFQEDDSRIW